MEDQRPFSIASLIAMPALITLAITILRLEGELHGWPKPWFNTSAGGGGAVIGISWLPIIFGPYFAFKLAGAGDVPPKMGRPLGLTALGLVVLVLGGVLFAVTASHPSIVTLIAFPVMLIGAIIPRIGWRSLGNTLIAYAFAARIPVLIVMYLAMRGNDGAGWGTHYDVAPPMFHQTSFGAKFFYLAFLPQMFMWIAYTVILGALIGEIIMAVRPGRHASQVTT